MIITQNCYSIIANKLHDLKYKEHPKLAEHLEECRNNGSLEDNPEYYQAFDDLQRLDAKIDELSTVLSSATIFSDTMKQKDTVTFGSTVKFKEDGSKKSKEYTILSIYDSDVDKGIISIESPFAKEMLGLHKGDYFDFNDKTYEIISICYSSQL